MPPLVCAKLCLLVLLIDEFKAYWSLRNHVNYLAYCLFSIIIVEYYYA